MLRPPHDSFQFYPTPVAIANKMATMLNSRSQILEPSAGNGALVEAYRRVIEGEYPRSRADIYVCEVSETFRRQLANDGSIIFGSDFLTADIEGRRFDGILMNPPFHGAYKHIRRAVGLLRPKGRLVALLPTGQLRDDSSQLSKILSGFKGVKITREGSAFINSDRSTVIDVSIVCIEYQEESSRKFNTWENLKNKFREKFGDEPQEEGLVAYDFLVDLVARYRASREAYKAVHDSTAELFECLPVALSEGVVSRPSEFNTFELELRRSCWNRVFNETQISSYMTTKMKQEFKEFTDKQGRYDFTVDNIKELLLNLQMSMNQIRERACVEVFEMMTSYSEHNKWQGWKTNKCGKVGKRVILPNWSSLDWDKKHVSLAYHAAEYADNLEKALCLLTGRDRVAVTEKWMAKTGQDITHRTESGKAYARSSVSIVFYSKKFNSGEYVETEFFKIKLYKTGTAHLVFNDEKILADLNEIVQRGARAIGTD